MEYPLELSCGDLSIRQKTFQFNGPSAISQFFGSNLPSISIISNGRDDARGVSIISNNRTTEWVEALPETPIASKDEDGRVLGSRVKCKTQLLTIANVYAPATPSKRSEWLEETAWRFNENEIAYHCDIIGGAFNRALLKIDRRGRATPASSLIIALNRLLTRLGRGECDYVDGWRTVNPKRVAYTYYKQNVGTSRIDRLYLRSELMENASEWRTQAPGIPRDHHAVRISLGSGQFKNRGPWRWRLNPLLLKLQTVQDQSNGAIYCLPGDDPMNERMIFKALSKQKLQERARDSGRSASKLQKKLHQRREKL